MHTWCDRLPADTPTSRGVFVICFEVEVDDITPCDDFRRLEVFIRLFLILLRGETAAFAQQDCPVAIRHFDMVALASRTMPYRKVVEVKHQNLPLFPLYCLCLLDVVEISSWESW